MASRLQWCHFFHIGSFCLIFAFSWFYWNVCIVCIDFDAIFVKRHRMLPVQFVTLYKTCKPKIKHWMRSRVGSEWDAPWNTYFRMHWKPVPLFTRKTPCGFRKHRPSKTCSTLHKKHQNLVCDILNKQSTSVMISNGLGIPLSPAPNTAAFLMIC